VTTWLSRLAALAAQSALPTAVPAAKLVDIAHARNVVILDSVVFLLGVGICVGVLAWWGRRIFTEK
jgi:hypothetical protein